MKTKSATLAATIWLDEKQLFVCAKPASVGPFGLEISSCDWNPDRLNILSSDAQNLLTQSLLQLTKEQISHRLQHRLCLGDSLCVTRVAVGDSQDVDAEIENIRQRSQLYLSLGLGDKLTGTHRSKYTNGNDYSLTSIVNRRNFQAIYDAISNAGIRLQSVEPTSLAISRGTYLLDATQDAPVLQAVLEDSRCDLTICRQGRMMLSYRIGFQDFKEAGGLVASNMARLRRFCERDRTGSNNALGSIVVFGDTQATTQFRIGLLERLGNQPINIQVFGEAESQKTEALSTTEVPSSVRLAIWSSQSYRSDSDQLIGPPDLLEQLAAVQAVSFRKGLIRTTWPAVIAACLIVMLIGFNWIQVSRTSAKQAQLEQVMSDVALADDEIAAFEKLQSTLLEMERFDCSMGNIEWETFTQQIAKCLPANARLESISLVEGDRLTLKGMIVDEDSSYEILSALKRLPSIAEVSVESIGAASVGTSGNQSFDIRCRIRPQTKTERLVQANSDTPINTDG